MPLRSVILHGRVESLEDPKQLGRVRVSVLGFGAAGMTLPWMPVLQPMASTKHGGFFLPEVGDEVVVLRGSGNMRDGLVCLGAVYNARRPPLVAAPADDANKLKELRTAAGALTFCDEEGKQAITIQTRDKKLSIVIDVAAGSVAITGDKLVSVSSSADLKVEARKVTVTGSEEIKLVSKTKVAVEAANVEVKVSGALAVK